MKRYTRYSFGVAVCAVSLLTIACTTQAPKDPAPTAKTVKNLTTKVSQKTTFIEPIEPMSAQLERERKDSRFIEVTIGNGKIAIDKKKVITYDNKGHFKEEQLRGLQVPTLTKAMTDIARPKARDDARFLVGLVTDKDVTVDLFVKVVYSLGQANYSPLNSKNRYVIIGGGMPYNQILFTNRVGDEPSTVKLSAPHFSIGPPSEKPKPKQITVVMTTKGFVVRAEQVETKTQKPSKVVYPAQQGCPANGPTICNLGGKDTTILLESLSTLKGDAKDKAIAALGKHYDFRSLYNLLVDLKAKNKERESINLAFDMKMPVDVIGLVASHVRFQRPDAGTDGKFKDDKSYYSKRFANQRNDRCTNGGKTCLFPFPILALN